MHLPALPTLSLLLLAGVQTAAASTLPSSRAHLTTFSLSSTLDCHNAHHPRSDSTISVSVPYGSACNRCIPLPLPAARSVRSIAITTLDPRCRVTLFSSASCEGEGIRPWAGGCWTAGSTVGEQGSWVGAYKVDCPWFDGVGPQVCKGLAVGEGIGELRKRQETEECLVEQDDEDDDDEEK